MLKTSGNFNQPTFFRSEHAWKSSLFLALTFVTFWNSPLKNLAVEWVSYLDPHFRFLDLLMHFCGRERVKMERKLLFSFVGEAFSCVVYVMQKTERKSERQPWSLDKLVLFFVARVTDLYRQKNGFGDRIIISIIKFTRLQKKTPTHGIFFFLMARASESLNVSSLSAKMSNKLKLIPDQSNNFQNFLLK